MDCQKLEHASEVSSEDGCSLDNCKLDHDILSSLLKSAQLIETAHKHESIIKVKEEGLRSKEGSYRISNVKSEECGEERKGKMVTDRWRSEMCNKARKKIGFYMLG